MTRFAPLGLVLALGCAPSGRAEGDEPRPGEDDPRVVVIDLGAGMPENMEGGLVQLPATRTYTGLVRALERALDAGTTAGLFVRLENQGLDMARAEELGALLGRFRDKKLPVVCHAHDYSNAGAWLAARGCSRVWLSAAGSMDSVGIAAEVVHLKGLLDRLKIQVDFLSMGRYKSGAEPLTREAPSDAARESLGGALASIRATWLESAEQGRPGRGLTDALELGPYTPEEARAAKLVDAVGYESEALADAKRLAKTSWSEPTFGREAAKASGVDFGTLVHLLLGGETVSDQPHISVVPAEGAIAMEGGGPFESGGISARAMVRTLQRLREDDAVKAVVLRIDSPGGSPLASDLIWHELMELRKTKPVIASVGAMAASGGYYVACAADRVIAEKTSIVGSIGVFGGKLVVGPALTEIGINSFTIPASPRAGAAERAAYLSPLAAWDDPTRERVRAHMQSIYDLFIERVAKARKMPADSVRIQAEGRIWSGAQGKERGLVDEIGGLSRALDLARKLSNLDRNAPVSVDGTKESLLELLLLGEDAGEAEIRAALVRFAGREHALESLPRGLQRYLSALAPLLEGDAVLAALPLAVTVR